MRYTPNGFKIPTDEDQDFWDQNEFNVERLDAHTHDGVDSEPLAPGATEPYKVDIAVLDWVGASAPYYYDVVFPIGWDKTWANGEPCPVQIVVRDTNETQVFLDTARVAATGIRVYSSVKAVYVVGLY
ncbi:MAG TPA: hypothetical protein VE954_43085 [Oligoflexus sp.]|uniref:hypothetical protein n=1 Tax=Oligoflexus sp. TaxID=1971216 RepID=UPI002D323E0C|nr:hypothetical protein [Oligoflexus sp.]HYX39929.1 hypothetical protein [Oligoflexus sp.]